MRRTMSDLTREIKIERSFLSNILAGRVGASWKTAKKLAAITKTDPVMWMEKQLPAMRASVEAYQAAEEKQTENPAGCCLTQRG